MRVLDMLNYTWYDKEDLIRESFNNLFNNGINSTAKEAFKEALQYVKENTLNEKEVSIWVKEHD